MSQHAEPAQDWDAIEAAEFEQTRRERAGEFNPPAEPAFELRLAEYPNTGGRYLLRLTRDGGPGTAPNKQVLALTEAEWHALRDECRRIEEEPGS